MRFEITNFPEKNITRAANTAKNIVKAINSIIRSLFVYVLIIHGLGWRVNQYVCGDQLSAVGSLIDVCQGFYIESQHSSSGGDQGVSHHRTAKRLKTARISGLFIIASKASCGL